MSVIVYHEAGEDVCDVMDGRLYRVPSGEPFEFASTFFGRKFIEHKHWWGVVEVKTIRNRGGIQFDLEDASRRARALLLQKDEEVIQNYVSTQYDDRLAHGKPALRPGGRAAKILEKHNVNLATYGLRPVGTVEGNMAIGSQSDPALHAQVQSLQRMVMMLVAGDSLSKEEKAALAREMFAGNNPGGAPTATPSQLHAVPEVKIRDSYEQTEGALGEATADSQSMPGDPTSDGLVDLGRSYAALGTVPGAEDTPPSNGPTAPVKGNLPVEEVISTLGRVEVRPPAAKGRRGN